jgi:hypothetical protein
VDGVRWHYEVASANRVAVIRVPGAGCQEMCGCDLTLVSNIGCMANGTLISSGAHAQGAVRRD